MVILEFLLNTRGCLFVGRIGNSIVLQSQLAGRRAPRQAAVLSGESPAFEGVAHRLHCARAAQAASAVLFGWRADEESSEPRFQPRPGIRSQRTLLPEEAHHVRSHRLYAFPQ